MCTLSCVNQIASGKLLYNTELSLALCDDLEGWDGRGKGEYNYDRFTVYGRSQHNRVKQFISKNKLKRRESYFQRKIKGSR